MTQGLSNLMSNACEKILYYLSEDDWIQTYTGKRFYFKNPQPDQICLEDIAHVLSMIPRYGGHSNHFLSVAEHSIHVSRHVEHHMAGLMHDAAETYTGDLVTPLKRLIPVYKTIENQIMADAISVKFNFTWNKKIHDEIKEIDKRMFVTEVLQLGKDICLEKWYNSYPPLDGVHLDFLPPAKAKEAFIERFCEIEDSRYKRYPRILAQDS